MANLVKSQLIPLVIPSKGMSTRFPLAAMPLEYSPWIQDYDNEGGFYESRKGLNFLGGMQYGVSAIASHPTNKNRLVFYAFNAFLIYLIYYDIVSNTIVDDDIIVGSSAGVNKRALAVNFNKNTYFFQNGTALGFSVLRFDGTNVSGTPYTGPTGGNVVFGFTYKHRMYLVTNLSSSIWYSNLDAVVGPTKQVDFASLTQDAGIIMCGFSFTLSGSTKAFTGSSAESLFALIFDTGEMLVFSGNYPDDVTTWNLISKLRMGAPLGYQSFIEKDGDVLVLTKSGIVSCRTLLTTAQGDVVAATITSEIERYWTQLIGDIQANETLASWTPISSIISSIHGSYHQQRNKIVIFVPKYLKPQDINNSQVGYVYVNAPAALVYDIATQAWTIHVLDILGAGNERYFINSYYWPAFGKLYVGSQSNAIASGLWEYWGNKSYIDKKRDGTFQVVSPQIKTAYVNTAYQSSVKGVFISHQGGYSKSTTRLQIVGDSGAQYTNPQAVSYPVVNEKITRDFYDVGITAENVSLSLTATTDAAGSMTNKPYKLISLTAMTETTRSPT